MLRGLFARRTGRPDGSRAEADRVKRLAESILALAPGSELTVSEITCYDPDCPGTETVILVMRPGQRTVAAKIGEPAADVTEQALRAALVASGVGEFG